MVEGEVEAVHFDFKIAHRGGVPCPVCGTTIGRALAYKRGTCFRPRYSFLVVSDSHKAVGGRIWTGG